MAPEQDTQISLGRFSATTKKAFSSVSTCIILEGGATQSRASKDDNGGWADLEGSFKYVAPI